MPLKTSKSKNEKDINKVVSKNIDELEHHGKKQRSQKQIIAIAESAARGRGKGSAKK